MKTTKSSNITRWAVFIVLALIVAGLLYLINRVGLSTNAQSTRQLTWLGQVLMLIVGMATVAALGALQSLTLPFRGGVSRPKRTVKAMDAEQQNGELGSHAAS
ncbi:MAG: hypothetical protein SF097_07365 [Acidobacteriota bacterium]|nr:hypothetical protein [Acidobacteriota bacterium]